MWIFDVEHMRFRRNLKDIESEEGLVFTHWRPYHRLQIHPREQHFVVWLNEQGSRRFRSALHDEDCALCHEHATDSSAPIDLGLAIGA
jgi:hypothetical protein